MNELTINFALFKNVDPITILSSTVHDHIRPWKEVYEIPRLNPDTSEGSFRQKQAKVACFKLNVGGGALYLAMTKDGTPMPFAWAHVLKDPKEVVTVGGQAVAESMRTGDSAKLELFEDRTNVSGSPAFTLELRGSEQLPRRSSFGDAEITYSANNIAADWSAERIVDMILTIALAAAAIALASTGVGLPVILAVASLAGYFGFYTLFSTDEISGRYRSIFTVPGTLASAFVFSLSTVLGIKLLGWGVKGVIAGLISFLTASVFINEDATDVNRIIYSKSELKEAWHKSFMHKIIMFVLILVVMYLFVTKILPHNGTRRISASSSAQLPAGMNHHNHALLTGLY